MKTYEFISVPELETKIGLPILTEHYLRKAIEEDKDQLHIYHRGKYTYLEYPSAKKWIKNRFGFAIK